MTFSIKDQDLIEFGKFIVMTSMHEMKEEGEDLNTIQFDYLIDKLLRNVHDREFFEEVMTRAEEEPNPKDWREDLV